MKSNFLKIIIPNNKANIKIRPILYMCPSNERPLVLRKLDVINDKRDLPFNAC
ncbi:hypothetical protein COSHB9_09830 [Companilactobacillus alimentarius]